MESFDVYKNIKVGGSEPLLFIAGPCQIESRDHAFKIAEILKKLSHEKKVNLVYKSSYDKANRTSLKGKRGIGLENGLKILAEIRAAFDLPVITDVHSSEEATAAGEVVDIIQIPAFLCRQTDLLLAAAKTGKVINVKKGQFLHPSDMRHVSEKVIAGGNNKVMLCERGTCFGYRDLVVDMRGLKIMAETGLPVIFDATHSVQSMGGEGGRSGGSREYVLPLVKAAVAVGVNGLFVECHDQPDSAPSDAASMLNINDMPELIDMALKIHEIVK